MSDPVSIRNIPPAALKLAEELSAQTGLSISDEFRLALASGLLIEATKVAPGRDGTFGGLHGELLAKALRRHLGSAIDLLIEYGQHPYQALINDGPGSDIYRTSDKATPSHIQPEKNKPPVHSIEDDLDELGMGSGLSDIWNATHQTKEKYT